MALTVKTVDEFLGKVERKAIKFVEDESKKAIRSYIEEQIESNGDYRALKKELVIYDAIAGDMAKASIRISAMLKNKDLGSLGDLRFEHPLRHFKDATEQIPLLDQLISSGGISDQIIKKMRKEKDEKVYSIRSVYRTLDGQLKGKTANKRMEYLEKAGFDVAWLKEQAGKAETGKELDKNLLFPCKDNK